MRRPKGRYYRVSPSFWIDNNWTDDTIIVALYLLTCRHRTTEGIFRLSLREAAEDLRWNDKRFARAFEALLDDGFVEYDHDARVCLIVNAMQWQAPENPNQIKAAVRAIGELPSTPLLARFGAVAQTLCPTLAEALRERFPQRFGEPLREGLREPLREGFAQPPYSTSTSTSTSTSNEESDPSAERGGPSAHDESDFGWAA